MPLYSFFLHKSWRINTNFFSCWVLHLYVVHEMFIEVPLFSWNSHPNFNRNIWGFANLPAYRKLTHNNISYVYRKPKILFIYLFIYLFFLVVFWRRYKIVCTYALKTLFIVILQRIHIIFIYKHCHNNFC